MPEPAQRGATKSTSNQDQGGHQHVVVGLLFQSKDANDRLASDLKKLQDRGLEVGQHRAASDVGVGAASGATADLADALASNRTPTKTSTRVLVR